MALLPREGCKCLETGGQLLKFYFKKVEAIAAREASHAPRLLKRARMEALEALASVAGGK